MPVLVACWLAAGFVVAAPGDAWQAAEKDGRVEATHAGKVMMAWQAQPLAKPAGGEKFAASAFLHPLCTPSGFVWTAIQPPDHLHHFGVWWPWKFIEVGGKRYNSWELQSGEGAHVARTVKKLDGGDGLAWEFHNEVLIKNNGTATPVIAETARVGITRRGDDTNVLDLTLEQKPLKDAVTIANYHYSGFSWRGPATWNRSNSTMITSEGHDRDHANGQTARWVVVTGPTPNGTASILLLSAANKLSGTPERLRVWDSKMGNGTPFVNFNPVVNASMPLDGAHPAVSHRTYRIVAADHAIDTKAAETEWQNWQRK